MSKVRAEIWKKKKSLFFVHYCRREENKIYFHYWQVKRRSPVFNIDKYGLQNKVCTEEKKENALPKCHSRNVKLPRKPSVQVCWPEIRGNLTKASGMVNDNEDRNTAKHRPDVWGKVFEVVLPPALRFTSPRCSLRLPGAGRTSC